MRRRRRSSPARRSGPRWPAAMAMLSRCRAGSRIGAPRHVAVQLGEGDHRAGEGDRPDGQAEGQLDQRSPAARPVGVGDAIGGRGVDGGHRHQAGGQADQASGRRPPAAAWRSSATRRAITAPTRAADGDAADDQAEGHGVERALAPQGGQGRADGDGHADHADAVAAPAGHRAGQAAQRQDEQDAARRDRRGRRGWRSCAAFTGPSSVHGQHALGDQEAAEDVDRGQARGDRAGALGDPDVAGVRRRAATCAAAASRAPTMITEEMALVTAISGVCRAGVTLQTT